MGEVLPRTLPLGPLLTGDLHLKRPFTDVAAAHCPLASCQPFVPAAHGIFVSQPNSQVPPDIIFGRGPP